MGAGVTHMPLELTALPPVTGRGLGSSFRPAGSSRPMRPIGQGGFGFLQAGRVWVFAAGCRMIRVAANHWLGIERPAPCEIFYIIKIGFASVAISVCSRGAREGRAGRKKKKKKERNKAWGPGVRGAIEAKSAEIWHRLSARGAGFEQDRRAAGTSLGPDRGRTEAAGLNPPGAGAGAPPALFGGPNFVPNRAECGFFLVFDSAAKVLCVRTAADGPHWRFSRQAAPAPTQQAGGRLRASPRSAIGGDVVFRRAAIYKGLKPDRGEGGGCWLPNPGRPKACRSPGRVSPPPARPSIRASQVVVGAVVVKGVRGAEVRLGQGGKVLRPRRQEGAAPPPSPRRRDGPAPQRPRCIAFRASPLVF